MERIRRVVVEVVVVDGGQLTPLWLHSRIFADFAEGGDAGRVADVGPATGESPGTVVAFDEEDAIVVEDGGADVDFGAMA